MRRYDFEESIGYWMFLGSQAYFRALSEALAPHGITFRQCQVLSILNLRGEVSQAELAAAMQVEPPTLVGVLDRMQRDGWVKRRPCKEDRRKWLIEVTPAANNAWDTIVDCAMGVRERAVVGLTTRQVMSLKRILDVVTLNLSTNAFAGAVSVPENGPTFRPRSSVVRSTAPIRPKRKRNE